MKRIFFLLLFACSFSLVKAQGGDGFERIHAAKVAYITDRVHFTADQSARFWPVYDQYESEVRTVRQRIRQNMHPAPGTDPMEQIENSLDYQQQILDLKKKYKDQFLKVISPTQLAQLYDAERDFKQMLVKQMREKHNGGR